MSDEGSIEGSIKVGAAGEVVQVPFPVARPRRYHATLNAMGRLADGAIILAGFALACREAGIPLTPALAVLGGCAVTLFGLFARMRQLYRSWRVGTIRDELGRTVEAWVGAMGPMVLLLHLHRHGSDFPTQPLLGWFLLTPVALCGWRVALRQALRLARENGLSTQRLAIMGSGEFARHIAETMARHGWIGFRVVGLFGDREPADAPRADDVRTLETLVRLARIGAVDVVYITPPPVQSEQRVVQLLEWLGDTTISAYLVHDRRSGPRAAGEPVVPGSPGHQWLHPWSVDIGGIEAVSLYETPFMGLDGWVKRVEDIVVSALALLLLAVPMLVIAAGVKRSGPGPVIFKQRRYGLDGREITVWKFRSMSQCDNGPEVRQATRNDPRVTPFGAFLRRTSLDELPQFINVFTGRMSVVGPRPHAVAHNEYYRGLVSGYMLRHKVKPGITGWAQVNGFRGETETLDKMRGRVELDLAYIRHWSLWLDARIILLTVLHGLTHKNAY